MQLKKANTNLTAIAFLQGNLLLAEKRYDEALEAYEKAKREIIAYCLHFW